MSNPLAGFTREYPDLTQLTVLELAALRKEVKAAPPDLDPGFLRAIDDEFRRRERAMWLPRT